MRDLGRSVLAGVFLGCCIVLAGLLPASAGESINVTDGNLAIKGYDAVAYFTQSAPVKGDPVHETTWQGARWRFASAAHRELFVQDPGRYAPRYGGFCAGAMALGWKAPIDPEAWVIVEDRLYLNYSKEGRDEFAADADARIADADANWERLGRVE